MTLPLLHQEPATPDRCELRPGQAKLQCFLLWNNDNNHLQYYEILQKANGLEGPPMHFVRVVTCFVLITFFSSSSITASLIIVKSKKLTVLGTLTEEMDADADPAWCIQLNPVIMVHGKQISSLQIKSPDTRKLSSLEDKFVQAKGKLTFSFGIETVQSPVFELSSIKEHKSRHSGRWF